ncbi:MAG TPA: hypothetical protein PKJ99_13535 [Thermoanaerobaculales bacterium]|nr:hypothetical protein [Thermoanaerobaculales bacterium]HQL29877.1 hypothetical protein [Thermoanaerobaculales bacterium]
MKHRQRLALFAALVVVTSSLLAAPPLAVDCPDLVHHWPGPISALAVSGDYAYLSDQSGLFIVDVADPSAPRVVGELRMANIASSIAVSGGYAYITWGQSRQGGLQVIDVSTPSSPVEVGHLGMPAYVTGVAVSGGHAYLTWDQLFEGGLSVIDVSTPAAPVEVGSIDTPHDTTGVAVAGSYAYVANGRAGLQVIDVSAPSSPANVGSIDTPGHASDVVVSGSYAYVADGSGGLLVIDVSMPADPIPVATVDLEVDASHVAVEGGYAYVASVWGGLRVIDIHAPSAPVEVGSVDMPGYSSGVAVVGAHAYLATSERGFSVVDVSIPAAPVEVGSVGTLGPAHDVAVSSGHAYVTGEVGLQVIDVSIPSSPVEEGLLVASEGVVTDIWVENDVAVAGDYAYIAQTICGQFRCDVYLWVIDVSTPSAPVAIGFVGGWPGRGGRVAVSGGYAYVVAYEHYPSANSGLRVIDVHTSSTPVEVGFVETPGDANDVAVSANWAFVADGDDGLRVIDVQTPSAPVEVGFVDTPGHSWGVAVSGGVAYLADGTSGLRVIDVSNPAAPVEVGFLDSPGDAYRLAVSGTHAYVAWVDEFFVEGGLQVIDVGDPSALVEVGSYDTASSANGVAVSDGSVFVTTQYAGLYIFSECGPSPDAHESFIPAAAFAAGAEGSFFQTDVEINNDGAEEAQVYFEWLPRGQDNSAPQRSATYALGAGRSLRFENALTTLFELGPDALGALKVVSSTESVIGMSRTYNTPGGGTPGTFGQGLPAVRATELIAGDEPQRIIFLSENPDFRANVGCVNGSSDPIRINIRAFDDGGTLLDTRTMDLGPWSNNQINRVFGGWTAVNGYVDVGADSEEASYYCYGSLLDNHTSDPATILPQVPLADTTFVPAAAFAAGLEGSFFETDLDLSNAGRRDITYELLWLPRGADNSGPLRSRTFSLAPGAGVRYANVLNSVFGLEPDQVGALAIEASGTELLAMSRTYNLPPVVTAGTFGQGLPAVRETVLIGPGQRKRILFMNESADFRSNVGCQNGSREAVRVFLELYDSDGNSLETKVMDLKPLSNNQITRVFRDHAPIEAGYVDVWTHALGGAIHCYGSVLDNLTSDPTTVLPQ